MKSLTLKEKWDLVKNKLSNEFASGDEIGVEGILFLIGVQELGKGYINFTKQEKQDIMHIALCTVLIPFGYYEFLGQDNQGWPHFENKKHLPPLKRGEQSRLIKEAIIEYFN